MPGASRMRRRVPPSSRRSRMGGVPQSLFLLSLSLTLLTFSTPSYLPVINPPPSSHNLSCDLLSERVQPECATSSSAASAPAKQSARGVAHIFNKQRSGDMQPTSTRRLFSHGLSRHAASTRTSLPPSSAATRVASATTSITRCVYTRTRHRVVG